MTEVRQTSYFVQVGNAAVTIDFEVNAISVVFDAAPTVRTENLDGRVLIDRDTRDGRIVSVEIIGGWEPRPWSWPRLA